jgi:hypothetical protein
MYPKATAKELSEIRKLMGISLPPKVVEEIEREVCDEPIKLADRNVDSSDTKSIDDNINHHDNSLDDSEIARYLDPQAEYHPVAFTSPLEMLECIFAGQKSIFTTPHPWQAEELNRISFTQCSNKEPLRYLLSANNGSGKDSFINAPWSVFQALCKIRSRTIITTSSYTQLVNQTESYIRAIAYACNNYFQKHGICEKMFIIKKEHVVCTQTGSENVMFVTDDSGRAEGYHPFPDYPDGEVTILINEAKTVPDHIFEALSRCTYSRWLEVSSPGKTSGKHYRHIRDAVNYPAKYEQDKFYARRITSYDCPHISGGKIESDKAEYGENSAIFRSKHLALFTSLDEQVVIRKESIEQALLFPSEVLSLGVGRRAGLDLAGGGDENALIVFDENRCIGEEYFRAKDTAEVTVPVLVDFFRKYKLQGDQIYADDGGIGQAILDGLRRSGYSINRVLMQSPPSQKGQYGNRGAELWFRFSQFAQYIIYPSTNDKLISQLTNRYYKQQDQTGKLILESKAVARAKGHGSPDRADAFVLAWTGVTVHMFLEVLGLAPKTDRKVQKIISQQEAMKTMPISRGRMALPMDFPQNEFSGNKGRALINNPARLLRECYK